MQKKRAVAKNVQSRTPGEIFVFGAVYVNALPESYVKMATDFSRRSRVPGYVAVHGLSSPPKPSELNGFTFER